MLWFMLVLGNFDFAGSVLYQSDYIGVLDGDEKGGSMNTEADVLYIDSLVNCSPF